MIGELQLTKLPVLSEDDWTAIEHICRLLKVFDEATEELSAEKSVTISKLYQMIDGIKDHLLTFDNVTDGTIVATMVATLKERFDNRSQRYEVNKIIAEATLLDPRFKHVGFVSSELYQRAETRITNMAGNNNNI